MPLVPPVVVHAKARADTVAVIARASRSGPLAPVLGSTPFRVVQVGGLGRGGLRVGATALLTLVRPRTDVSARVPGATFTAPALRDLLVNVDLPSGRVVGAEPGPGSETTDYDQPAPLRPTEQPATTPRLVRLSPRGPAFLSYDGARNTSPATRDWPVSLIFAGHASVDGVKVGLRKVGFSRSGHSAYLAYRGGPGPLRFDSDRGLKTVCDANGTDVHVRLYAPSPSDRFVDPRYGSVVVATTHLDRGDGCGAAPRLFGFSEAAEARVAHRIATGLHWQVRRNALPLGNAEPFRRDLDDPGHVWWSDGRATLIRVPTGR